MKETTLGDVDDIAASWAARTLSGSMTVEERAELDEWLSQDGRHFAAYRRYMGVADLADESGAQDGVAADLLQADLEAFALKKPDSGGWRLPAAAIAASIAALALFVAVITPSQHEPLRYATAAGGNMRVPLADGSVMMLNTSSAADVAFTDVARVVTLDEGEAFFDVAPDAARPFVVNAAHAVVRVVGTSFNVRAVSDETIVSVAAGVVEIGTPSATGEGGETVTLAAGEEAVIGAETGVEAISVFDPAMFASWRRGVVYYDNEPLVSVLADLNRYYAAPIGLADPGLKTVPVTGGFDITNQEVAVEALTIALSLQAERDASGRIILSPR